jgi:uroporphyrinogen-III synthase
MRRVLVLRPEPGATATVKRARQLGLDAIAIALFEIEPIPWTPPQRGEFDALLLTSANAVRHGGEELRKVRELPVYAVGEATADAAREAGFRIAGVGDAGVDRLLGTIPPDLKLLHLCGEDRKAPSVPQPTITPITVYRAIEIRERDIEAFSEGIALVHSPRAGRRFAELVNTRSGIAVAAISPAAAEAVGGGWDAVETAGEPSDEALLALAARLCNKPATQ